MLNNEKIIDQWKENYNNDRKNLKLLAKLNNNNNFNNFFNDLFFDDVKIIAKIGLGYNCLNKLTIRLITETFGNIIYKNDLQEDLDILICTDGSPELKDYFQNIADVLKNKNITSIAFDNFEGYDKKFVCRTIKKLELSGGIFIQKTNFNNEIYNIFFIDSNGNSFNRKNIKNIEKEIKKIDIFEIKSIPSKINFISNIKIINDYVIKALSLSNRKNDQKKIKIAISNYNYGVTQILKKIFGNMNFNYRINNNLNKKNIYQKKTRNQKTYLNFFRREIRFAKINKCNILICPSRDGSELFLFIFDGKKMIYLNSNEITLKFLNYFLTEFKYNSKIFLNSYIGTDMPPIKSIKNLINKYEMQLFISEDIEFIEKKYLLFFWNHEGQFIFGENEIFEFEFYHLIIKFLEMINYYETQRLNIVSQRNLLKKMYGDYQTDIIILNFEKYKLDLFLNNINSSNLYKNFGIKNVFKYELTNILNENLIAKITLKNEMDLLIKFNYINKKIIVYINFENNTSTRLIYKNFPLKLLIFKIKLAIKKDLKNLI